MTPSRVSQRRFVTSAVQPICGRSLRGVSHA